MNIILGAASIVLILVSVDVLSAMRPGVTCWALYPAWLSVATAAFGSLFVAGPVPWPIAGLAACMAGLLWRMRERFVWEARHRATGAAASFSR